MTVIIENEQHAVPYDEKTEDLIKKVVLQCFENLEFKQAAEVSILLVDDEEMAEINKKERGIAGTTDVLSFPMLSMDEGRPKPSTGDYDLDEESLLLGDIVISMETMARQALEYGHAISRELAFLVTHGMLHLLGYDHMTSEDEKKMFDKQEQVLTAMGLERLPDTQ